MSLWPSPLEGCDTSAPLPTTKNCDGKSLASLPRVTSSPFYTTFARPIDPSNNAFDFHIYYMQGVLAQKEFARQLHERIRREFPEMRIYQFWERPVGPHPVAMFEVNTFTPHQTGTLFSWLAVNRGPCSVMIHPNTGDQYRDHTDLVTWMGPPWPLNTELLKKRP
ncbi:hypothetical protein FISHEDRAFT_64017 [Fistulina hepatica ATCC 64428]|uniref:Dopa 4,5-dioxygenase n=1 Tax=Fistulina hepatica ATCC 64428 TaxID=1128425 RepID=A0A0D7AJC0_9AGAR|nr:hypothetical protein FISHEDRAFT_64017 [Fistulina hepatica ATCC 64428]